MDRRPAARPTKENDMTTTTTAAATQPTSRRTLGRWMISFLGFPLGGAAAILTVGPVDSLGTAVVGGLVTGAVLGAVQGWAMRADRALLVLWTVATAVGLAGGLAVGTALVDFGTGLDDLVLQGAVSGFGVGVAQAAVLFRRTGPRTPFWPAWLAVVWAVSWAVSTSIGIQVGDQFTVFGAAGALTATLLTAALPGVVARASAEERS
jgi:hypothetical protein